jgi:hypothetical protein
MRLRCSLCVSVYTPLLLLGKNPPIVARYCLEHLRRYVTP